MEGEAESPKISKEEATRLLFDATSSKEAFRLVAAGADVNQKRGSDGRNAVHHACAEGRVEVVGVLLGARAFDPDILTDEGETCLQIAERLGQDEVITYVEERYESSLARRDHALASLVERALEEDDIEKIEELFGAEEYQETLTSLPILHDCNSVDMAQLVLSKQPGANSILSEGMTPFLAQCRRGNLELLKWFIQQSADPAALLNQRTKHGDSPCDLVAISGDVGALRWMKRKQTQIIRAGLNSFLAIETILTLIVISAIWNNGGGFSPEGEIRIAEMTFGIFGHVSGPQALVVYALSLYCLVIGVARWRCLPGVQLMYPLDLQVPLLSKARGASDIVAALFILLQLPTNQTLEGVGYKLTGTVPSITSSTYGIFIILPRVLTALAAALTAIWVLLIEPITLFSATIATKRNDRRLPTHVLFWLIPLQCLMAVMILTTFPLGDNLLAEFRESVRSVPLLFRELWDGQAAKAMRSLGM